MKTKHLFATMMLPALFAACTNEELISTTTTNPSDLSDRPIAGDVRLNFSMDNDIMTRLDNDFKWTANDKIGACLMDDYDASGSKTAELKAPWMKYYTFIDYIHTNYRYTFDGEETWNNGDLLCQGNYFFYYPYDANLNSRTAFEKILNPNQEMKDLKSPRQVINDNQMYLGYKYVEGATEGDTQPLNVDLSPVFAFPAFSIKNVGTTPRTIEKIALQYQDGTKVWNLVATVNPSSTNINLAANPATTLLEDPTKAVVWSSTPTLDKDATGSAKQIQVTMPENTVLGVNETLNTYIVVPAGEYGTTDKVTLYIYTTDGVVTAPLDQKHENSSTGGATQYNVTNDVAFEDIYPYTVEGKYFVCNVTFDNLAVEKPGETTISSTEDLDTYLSWFKNTSGTGGVALTINTLGDDVELSKAAYDILNGNKLIKATFKGNLTLAEGVGENVLDLITIDGTTARTLTNKADINVPATLAKDVTLVNEGTITLSAVANAYTNKFENNGTMNITAPNAQSTVQLENLQAGCFTNNGELNMSGNVKLTGAIGVLNNNEVNILSGAVNGKIANGFTADGESYTNGVINVAEGATWTIVGTTAYNKGIINNNGAISVTSSDKFENFVAQSYGTKGATFEPAINNYGSIRNITNNGIVKMASESASYSTVAITGATGKVDNTICNNQITASSTETIYCEVSAPKTFTEVNEMVANSGSQLVRFVEGANTLTIDATVAQDGTVTGSIIIADQVEIVSDLTIATENANAKARIYGSGTTEELQITIGEDATATLGNGVKLHVGRSQKGTEVTADGTLKITANAYLTAYDATNGKLTINGNVENYGQIAGTASQYVEGTTPGWTGNNSSTTAISFN